MKRSREPQQDIDPASPGTDSHSFCSSSSQHASKYTELDPSALADPDNDNDNDDDAHHSFPRPATMRCFLPPHPETLSFASHTEYEAHYNSFHTNRCLQCRRNFPSQHLLGVHIEECHDPIVKIKRDQGEHTYSCFVQDCERKCLTHQKRRMHMIDKHMYPKNFFFAVTLEGIDGRRSLLNDGGHRRHRRRQGSGHSRPSTASQTKSSWRQESRPLDADEMHLDGCGAKKKQDAKQPAAKTVDEADVDAMTNSMASLRFVPAAVKYGNRNRPKVSK